MGLRGECRDMSRGKVINSKVVPSLRSIMRKKSGIIKRALSLLLIFLLSINSFAAIVSDNDGSAFVTKQEFEALKASFNKQIDEYNASIDGKIDGAIASYLAGLRLSNTETGKNYIYTIQSNLTNL